jgi:hypothetical protein
LRRGEEAESAQALLLAERSRAPSDQAVKGALVTPRDERLKREPSAVPELNHELNDPGLRKP